MKRKKIIIVLGLALMFNFFSVKTFASGQNVENDLVSVQEYVSLMKNAYQKYGMELEVLDSSNYTPITREVLELKLEAIENSGKAMVKANLDAEDNHKSLVELSTNTRI